MLGNIIGLVTGTYTITVTDANTCTGTTSFTINNLGSPITLSLNNIVNPTCNGLCNGSLTAIATGGVSPFVYYINPVGNIYPVSGIASNLCGGYYTVTATDAIGCSIMTTVSIYEPLVLINNAVSNPSSCGVACTGSVLAQGFGGTTPYTHAITGNNFNNLCTGTYTVTTTDANSCSTSTVVAIITGNYNNAINPNLVVTNGNIVANPTNGTAPYTYSLNGAPFVANNAFNMLCNGIYTLTIKDSYLGGCLKDTIFFINNAATFFP